MAARAWRPPARGACEAGNGALPFAPFAALP